MNLDGRRKLCLRKKYLHLKESILVLAVNYWDLHLKNWYITVFQCKYTKMD